MPVLVKPLFCAGLCAAAAWLAKDLALRFLPQFVSSESWVLLLAIAAAVALAVGIYGVSMLLCRAITQEDLEILPAGKKLGKTLAKFKLIG
jgi:hypothetical protein